MDLSKELLKTHNILESSDVVSKDPDTTYFKKRTRLHQALWRENCNFPIGTQPIKPKDGEDYRVLGSRIDLDFAKRTYSNFLSEEAKNAVINRLNNPEPKQTLYVDRLFADLLSSMPMCFNLFSPLAENNRLATSFTKSLWPDTPGSVTNTRFEWSPGRQIPGRFLENRSAFDAAFEIETGTGKKGVVGIETKYHEHSQKPPVPSRKRIARYKYIALQSGIFTEHQVDSIIGTHLQQVWLDHLLVLSMLVDSSRKWDWVKFVLISPAKNPSYRKVAEEYETLIDTHSSFEFISLETVIDNPNFPSLFQDNFRTRYIW